MVVIKNRVAPKFHASANFKHTNKLLVTIHFQMKTKNKRTEKSWKWRKATARKIGSKQSPEAKAMIYICTRHSQMHRKRLNEHIREHNHWGCAQCVYGWSSCVQCGFYMLLIMQYSFTTWHIKLLLFYRMFAIKYWMAMHLAKKYMRF